MSKTIEAARADLECVFAELFLVANAVKAEDLVKDIESAKLNAGVDLAPIMCEYYTTARVGFADFARAVIAAGIDQQIILFGKRVSDILAVYPKNKFTAKQLYEYTQIVNRAKEFTILTKDVIPYDKCDECDFAKA